MRTIAGWQTDLGANLQTDMSNIGKACWKTAPHPLIDMAPRHIYAYPYMKTLRPARTADQIFRALSDRTRLRILALLGLGERCVCDLVAVLGLSQPKVSRHLAYLRRAGLVLARKEGHWSYYRLATPRTSFEGKLMTCVRDCFAGLPEVERDAFKLARLTGNRCC